MSPSALVRLLHEYGILNRDIVPSMSLCLGPCDISVSEMVGAYSAFPMKGVRRVPMYVTRIEDSEGNIVAEFLPRVHEVISEESSYKMITLMRGVVDSGTGGRMRNRYKIYAPMGGKTGTTNMNSDGWFVGYTPSLTFGAWVGGEERDIHFAATANAQGSNSALPIAAYFLQKLYADKTLRYSATENFDVPYDFNPCASNDEEFEEDSKIEEVMLDDLTN